MPHKKEGWPPNPEPVISVIMPCHHRAYDVARTLRAYDSQDVGEPFELIAVDDGSTDETFQVLQSFHPCRYQLRVERLGRNQGPAAARNLGIRLSRAPILLFVGDDIQPETNLVRGHLIAHRYYPEVESAVLGKVAWPADLLVNTLMNHIDGIGAQQFSYHYLRDGKVYDFRHFYTANVSLKRELLFSLNQWFDTSFRYAAFEDAELAYRLAQRGMQIHYAAPLIGYHYHYHTIWSFSDRQYRSGIMAAVFLEKHPAARSLIAGRRWPVRKISWQMQAHLQRGSLHQAVHLEKQCLFLLSDHEWVEHPLLDTLYIGTLHYFFMKGLISATFHKTEIAQRIHASYAKRMLSPLLTRYQNFPVG